MSGQSRRRLMWRSSPDVSEVCAASGRVTQRMGLGVRTVLPTQEWTGYRWSGG